MADGDTEEPTPQSQSDSSSSDSDDSDSAPVESLVAGREKRSTAANRYDRERIIEEAEEAGVDEEDEVNLLFADDENEEDEEFEGSAGEADEDNHLDSSSDYEDQGPNMQADDLEGEKELQKQDKVERAKKRKADLLLTTAAGLRKKVKIDPTLPQKSPTAMKIATRKEKLRTQFGLPKSSRTSLRKQTVAHRQITDAKLKEDEKQRVKFLARKEKRDRERQRDAPPQMTQADRLAEAEKTERRNAKSLNRWETMEKKRAEEQAAKLAALKNRKLEGPVVTLWSGVAKWTEPRVNGVGSKDVTQDLGVEVKKRGRKSKAYHEAMAAARESGLDQSLLAEKENTLDPSLAAIPRDQTTTPAPSQNPANPPTDNSVPSTPVDTSGPQITFATPRGPENFLLEGIQEYATRPAENEGAAATSSETPGPSDVVVEADSNADQPPNVGADIEPDVAAPPPAAALSEQPKVPASDLSEQPEIPASALTEQPEIPVSTLSEQPELPTTSQEPLVAENAMRNLVVLEGFDQLAVQDRVHFSLFYNQRKAAKPVKQSHELCPITALPVRYRDPSTGVVYANSFAYRKIQELKRQEHTWSVMLGCYVGRAGVVARGVPEGFLGP